jgi:AcrR family transcriptional regulator
MHESRIRDKILITATKLFYKQGYSHTGINQIIIESEIAKGSFYNHFKSKTNLLIAYIEELDRQIFLEVDAILLKHKNPKDKLLALVDYRIERFYKSNFKGCPLIKIAKEISVEEEEKVLKAVSSHKHKFKNIIKNLTHSLPETSAMSSEELGDTIHFLLEGSNVDSSMQHSPASMKKARSIIKKLI